jgi:hypothetical protein
MSGFKEINKTVIILAALLVAVGIASCGMFIGSSIKYFRNFNRYVEVKGLAERTVKADQASWQIGFSAAGNNLKEIYNTIENEQHTVTNFLLQQGFTNTEIQKQPINITDNYANFYGSTNAKLPRYSATAGINVISGTIDKITQAVQLTNQLVESGVVLNRNGVAYLYTGLNSIKASMLNEALANAKVAAEEFAKNSSSKLDKIRMASQGLFTITAPDTMLGDSESINKKVRVVTTVQFFLK